MGFHSFCVFSMTYFPNSHQIWHRFIFLPMLLLLLFLFLYLFAHCISFVRWHGISCAGKGNRPCIRGLQELSSYVHAISEKQWEEHPSSSSPIGCFWQRAPPPPPLNHWWGDGALRVRPCVLLLLSTIILSKHIAPSQHGNSFPQSSSSREEWMSPLHTQAVLCECWTLSSMSCSPTVSSHTNRNKRVHRTVCESWHG